MVRVLVTGGLGFLGHAVTRRLVQAGHEVVVLSSRNGAISRVDGIRTVHSDIRDGETLARVVRQVEPEGVCHLAALTKVRDSFESPVTYFDVNVGGTVALVDALSTVSPVLVVFSSTGAVYGPCEGRIDEEQPAKPTNPYAASKLAAEELLAYQASTGDLGVVTLRCFNVAGAVDGVCDSDRTRIIPKAIAVAAGVADELQINGDGKAVREFTHVVDMADAVVRALAAAQPGSARTYNLGSGVKSTMLDVVQVVEATTGRSVPVRHLPPKPEPTVLMADSTRIRAELGWRPRHSELEEIVRDAWGTVDHQG
jgi:UDP-glucose 4-epimerase